MATPKLDVRSKRKKRMKGDLKGFFLNHWKMDLPLTDVITTTDGGDLWGYEKLRSRIVKFEKHFRHPNADVT